MKSSGVSLYLSLIADFVERKMSVTDFERAYITTFLDDHRIFTDDVYEILNRLFSDVDVFNPRPDATREELDESQLRERAKLALEALRLATET